MVDKKFHISHKLDRYEHFNDFSFFPSNFFFDKKRRKSNTQERGKNSLRAEVVETPSHKTTFKTAFHSIQWLEMNNKH